MTSSIRIPDGYPVHRFAFFPSILGVYGQWLKVQRELTYKFASFLKISNFKWNPNESEQKALSINGKLTEIPNTAPLGEPLERLYKRFWLACPI